MAKPASSAPAPSSLPRTPSPASAMGEHELRCSCGKLLARVLHSVLELKCARCKRVMLVVGGRRFTAADAGSCTCSAEPSPGI